jgi:hypothetical protein
MDDLREVDGRVLRVEGGTVLDLLTEFGLEVAPWEDRGCVRIQANEFLIRLAAEPTEPSREAGIVSVTPVQTFAGSVTLEDGSFSVGMAEPQQPVKGEEATLTERLQDAAMVLGSAPLTMDAEAAGVLADDIEEAITALTQQTESPEPVGWLPWYDDEFLWNKKYGRLLVFRRRADAEAHGMDMVLPLFTRPSGPGPQR